MNNLLVGLLVNLLISNVTVAAPIIYHKKADLTTLQTHGFKPHLHTKAQPIGDPQWQTLVRQEIDGVSKAQVLHVLVQSNIRYTEAFLSYSVRVVVCNSFCNNVNVKKVITPSSIIYVPAHSKYVMYNRQDYWKVQNDISDYIYVELQVRLLTRPINGFQGSKVYFVPNEQSLTIAKFEQ